MTRDLAPWSRFEAGKYPDLMLAIRHIICINDLYKLFFSI